MTKQVRKNYTEEFRREAVRLVTEEGYKIAEAARSLGINGNMLGRWVRQARASSDTACPGKGTLSPEQEEIRRLREENKRLRMEKEILKNVWSAPIAQAEDQHSIKSFASMYPAC